MLEKSRVIKNSLDLNGDDKKYKITIDGDKIITEVKWMDAVFFAPSSVTDEMRNFKFTAKVNDDGTWNEIDESTHIKKTAGAGGLGMSYSSFKGKEISFNKTIGFGKNKEDDSIGVISVTFNSEEYKKPVREYLASCGYKKTSKGFFSSLFKK